MNLAVTNIPKIQRRERPEPLTVQQQLERDSTSEAILLRVADGDAHAVKECIEKYGRLVWTLAKRFSPCQADAEDAAQEIFMELWQKASRFEPQKSGEATFVTMIARRRLIDRFRKRSRSLETQSMGQESVESIATAQSDVTELVDEASKATRCLDGLRPDFREVLKRSIHDGHSHSQIADDLKMPLGTVKSSARRGLNQLRECMQRFAPVSLSRGVS
jgi:RNA polymerase sigma factor (sigma-70 family)